MASATEEQKACFEEISVNAQSLQKTAEQLKSIIENFRI